MYYNESSYYRANPFYRQGYLPDRALLNRHPQEHVVELPQGESPFDPTRRKHFGLSDKSEIHENQLFADPDERTKPTVAIYKQFQRNLETKDIEGAVTNTLISPVIKNRMKSQQMKQIYIHNGGINGQAAQPLQYPNRQHQLTRVYQDQATAKHNKSEALIHEDAIGSKRNYHLRNADNINPPEQLNIKAEEQQASRRPALNRQEVQQPPVQPAPEHYPSIELEKSKELNDSGRYQQQPDRPVEQHVMQRQFHSQDKYQAPRAAEIRQPFDDEIDRTRNMNAIQAQVQAQRANAQARAAEETRSQRSESFRTIDQPQMQFVAPRRINPTFLSYGSNPFNLVAKNIIHQ